MAFMAETSERNDSGHSRYVDLMSDIGFKRVFSSPGHEDLLIGLLSVLLPGVCIKKLTYLDKEKVGQWREAKKTAFDVLCETDTGSKVMIEVQVTPQAWFKDRTVFYASQVILEQHKEGDDTYELTQTISVSILDFNLKHESVNSSQKLLWNFSIRDDDSGEKLSDCLHLAYLELPKFNKRVEELETFADKIYFCLRHMGQLKERPAKMNDKFFKRLFKVAEIASMTAEEQNIYFDYMTTERDLRNQFAYAREQGQAEGEARGEAKGIAQVASKLKAIGIPISQIAQATGLSANEVALL